MPRTAASAAPASTIRRPDRRYAGYLFDLDGTIYLGDGLLPGSQRLIAALRSKRLQQIREADHGVNSTHRVPE